MKVSHWSNGMSAKSVSVAMAYAAWRYALGGKDNNVPIRECIEWLEIMEKENDRPAARRVRNNPARLP
jgi:hypothetical protein